MSKLHLLPIFTLLIAMPLFGQEAIPLSLINLISTPKEFHMKKVSVSGYFIFGLEDQSLCLLPSPPSRRECVWVQITIPSSEMETREKERKMKYAKWQSMSGQIFTLEGIFNMNDEGHLGGWSGGITPTEIWQKKLQNGDTPKSQNIDIQKALSE